MLLKRCRCHGRFDRPCPFLCRCMQPARRRCIRHTWRRCISACCAAARWPPGVASCAGSLRHQGCGRQETTLQLMRQLLQSLDRHPLRQQRPPRLVGGSQRRDVAAAAAANCKPIARSASTCGRCRSSSGSSVCRACHSASALARMLSNPSQGAPPQVDGRCGADTAVVVRGSGHRRARRHGADRHTRCCPRRRVLALHASCHNPVKVLNHARWIPVLEKLQCNSPGVHLEHQVAAAASSSRGSEGNDTICHGLHCRQAPLLFVLQALPLCLPLVPVL
eukprot:365744-Chlamydomonas_euryale.AAC.19